MSSDATVRLEGEIAGMRLSLAYVPEGQREAFLAQIAAKEAKLAALRSGSAVVDLSRAQAGDVSMGDVAGQNVNKPQGPLVTAGVQSTRDTIIATVVNQIFQQTEVAPKVDVPRLLGAYLDRLLDDCQKLRLDRLTARRQDGNEQESPAQRLKLEDVYTGLTTDGPWSPAVARRTRPVAWLKKLVARLDLSEFTQDDVAPEQVRQIEILSDLIRVRGGDGPTDGIRGVVYGPEVTGRQEPAQALEALPDNATLAITLVRPELALEVVYRHRLLVILGEPGAGKSTTLRYLALKLVRRLRGERVHIPGWPPDKAPIPLVVPLGQVGAALRTGETDPYQALLSVVRSLLDEGERKGLAEALMPAVHDGGILLLCDGLDELPAAGGAGVSPRAAVASALRRLGEKTGARIVVTSRVLPYKESRDWQLTRADHWELRTIQPLAFGQVRTFVSDWYKALGLGDPELGEERAAQRAEALIEALGRSEHLGELGRSPLLLTMIAILHHNAGTVPPDRVDLYNECVQLLLDRWEPKRQPGLARESLIERLGLRSIEPLRDVLHRLAFDAHAQPPGDDGRGIVSTTRLIEHLRQFFEGTGRKDDALQKVEVFRNIIKQDDAGLLQRRDEDVYVFPHLTFQEYLAACHLASLPFEVMVEEVQGRWQSDDRERWRQVLLLLMGRLAQQSIVRSHGLPFLSHLVRDRRRERDGNGRRKRVYEQRDLVLAALSYRELAERNAIAGTLLADMQRDIERRLGAACEALLKKPEPAIGMADRLDVARVLGALGDPRFPVERKQWRQTLRRERPERFTAEGTHYWRYIPGGPYQIGGWNERQTPDEAPGKGEEQNEREKPVELTLAPLWVARLPITVAQYAPFVAEGYGADAERWWTPEGWNWKQDRTEPVLWDDPRFNGHNQPVVGVNWYEATAYCALLTEQLGDALPADHVVRLPTEAEWEAAASSDGQGGRRIYPWGEGEATPERAIYAVYELNAAAPVGCCSAGAAACGALDMVGNVWEWTCSSHQAYPAGAGEGREDFTPDEWDVPLRGHAYYGNSTNVRCGARYGFYPNGGRLNVGFRVIVAPRLARMS